ITGVQQSGSKQKQRKSDEEYSDSAERASSRGTSRGKRRGARGARGAGELRRSQRISKAPTQGHGEEGEDEGEDEEEEVLLTSTQQKTLQTQQTPPIQQTQQRQMAQIVILRSRSWATTPGVETDVLAEFEDIAIRGRGTSVDDRSPGSRRSTPVIEENIEDIAPSSKLTGTKRRDSTRIEAMLVKQGRQIRALYELQKSTFEKVTSIQSQLKKTNKNIELSSKVFSVSNNLITDSYHI